MASSAEEREAPRDQAVAEDHRAILAGVPPTNSRCADKASRLQETENFVVTVLSDVMDLVPCWHTPSSSYRFSSNSLKISPSTT